MSSDRRVCGCSLRTLWWKWEWTERASTRHAHSFQAAFRILHLLIWGEPASLFPWLFERALFAWLIPWLSSYAISCYSSAPPESAPPASSYYSAPGPVYSLAAGVTLDVYLVALVFYLLRLRASAAESPPSPSIPYECRLFDMNIERISATELVMNGWSKAWSAVIRSSLSQIRHF